MVDDLPGASDATTNTISVRSWFDRAATWILAGSLAMGALLALRIALSNGAFDVLSWIDVLCRAGYAIIAHGLAGLALAALVRALGVWAWTAAERPREQPRGELSTSTESPRGDASAKAGDEELAAVRRSIELGEWDAADELIRRLTAERPDDHRVTALADDLRRAKLAVGRRWTEELRAAREVNDPNRVLELYGQSPPVQDDESRRALDQDLAQWFLSLVHRRLRGGGAQLEIVTLVERVSDTFGHTVEGASLRAALPTLRRSVGLCPRCGRPYAGTADACPLCLAGNAPAPSAEAGAEAEAEAEIEPDLADVDEPPTERRDSEWFMERGDDDSPA